MPVTGTIRHAKSANAHPYGSFGNTKIKNNTKVNQHANVKNKVNNQHVKVKENDDEDDTTDDIDSGMSSEENEDSLKSNTSNVSNIISTAVVKQEIIKCLEQECVDGNEIPSCSSDVKDVCVVIDKSQSQAEESQDVNTSEFIVIDLTCDVEDLSELSRSEVDVGVNSSECDEPSECSVDSLSLVPVANNELVQRENQKLLSLSLSILLAALLQAMRCFAQFLEDIIVIPQR